MDDNHAAEPAAPPRSGPSGLPRAVASERVQRLWRDFAAEPWHHDFFNALRWIESRHPELPRLGTARRPSAEPLRLGQAPDLSFAPAALHAMDLQGPKPRLDVRFFGLFGPNGPLPLHLTEYARERAIHAGDLSLKRFADLFHHRLLLLFYRAWAQAQPTASLDRPHEDRFADWLGALVGIGEPTLRGRNAAPDHARLHFAGLLSRQVRNPEGLEKMLGGVLARPVRVECFVGAWLRLPVSERSRIGRSAGSRHNPTAQLGRGAVLGAAVWDRQHNFRIQIGPLDAVSFDALLPDGAAMPVVMALIDHYVGDEFGWDLRLVPEPDQIRSTRLGRHGRLGWTSWTPGMHRGASAYLTLSPSAAVRRKIREQHTSTR